MRSLLTIRRLPPVVGLLLAGVVTAAGGAPPLTGAFFGTTGHAAFSAPASGGALSERPRQLRELGIRWERLLVPWSAVEPRPDETDWRALDRTIAAYRRERLQLVLALAATPVAPTTADPDPIRRYRRWVEAAVRRYRDDVGAWELVGSPAFAEAQAFTVLAEAAAIVARYDGQAPLAVSVPDGIDLPWLRQLLARPDTAKVDALCLRPIAGGPELLERQLALLARAVTDFSAPRSIWLILDAPEATLPHLLAVAATAGVERVFWHAPQLPAGRDGAHVAILAAFLRDVAPIGRLPLADARLYGFAADRAMRWIAWGPADGVALPLPQGARVLSLPVGSNRAATLLLGRDAVLVEIRDPRARDAVQPLPPASEPPLVNGDFRERDGDAPLGWHRGTHTGASRMGEFHYHSGPEPEVALRGAADAAWESDPAPVWGARVARLSVRVRPERAGGSNGVELAFYRGDATTPIHAERSQSITGSSGWVTVSLLATVPPEAVFARVRLVARGNPGEIRFAAVRLALTGSR